MTNQKKSKRAVGVIYKEDKVLLVHRIKRDREYFVFPGGEVEEGMGESPQTAVVREIREETSLTVLEPKEAPFLILKNDYSKRGGREGYYFLFDSFSGIPKLGGPEKERMNHENQYHLVWKTLQELKDTDNLFPQEARDKIFKYLSSKYT